MTTDRELIEAAAKTAGIKVWWNGRTCFLLENGVATHEWNPLTDDSQAFKLMVKLGMRDYFYVEIQKTCVQTSFLDPHEEIFYEAFKDQDPCAATRRAIVKAAAELGRLL